MNRRTWIGGGAAALAGVAGVGVAWQKFEPHAVNTPSSAPGGAGSAASDPTDPVQTFWSLVFDTPDGKSLAMRRFKGSPVLVNFWATWCPPCVEELPLLDSFYNANKANNWTVIGLAVDQPSAVNKWLQAKPLSFPVGMAGLDGTGLSKSLGNRAGSLPFSVVFGASGDVLQRKIGKISADDLAQWVKLR
ncbi:MAG: putative thioredoxin family protein [Polaromonas sp.]|nr:putative thioredoxin family protein [Polaromonas sp.]